MATSAANAALLEHIRVSAAGGRGAGRLAGGGLPASGSKFLTHQLPLRAVLLPVDKCGIQAWWQACRGEAEAAAQAKAAITDRGARTGARRHAARGSL